MSAPLRDEADKTIRRSKFTWPSLRRSKGKTHKDSQYASTSSLDQNTAIAQPCVSETVVLRGHRFGDTIISESATAQLGDSHINAGSQSHIGAPSTIHGNMNVNINNICAPNSGHHHTGKADLELRLKQALYYDAMEQRKAQLSNITPASFDWIWTETNFASWLRGGEGIFWIVGQPASGKSTLIHHLVTDIRASELVKECLSSSGKEILVLHFFFDFRARDAVPNTPIGMLRSLLLQLIEASSTVQAYVMSKTEYRLNGQWPLMESELMNLLSGAITGTQASVCGFIDGLDEYTGDLKALANTIIRLQSKSGMKLCLASRPEPKLASKLPQYAFRMQDHNHGTICAYVRDACGSLPPELVSARLKQLFDQIPVEANGVILWARLAADEVSDAILEGSNFPQVQNRLDELPRDLNEVYGRVWNNLKQNERTLLTAVIFVISQWNVQTKLSSGKAPADRTMLCCDLLIKIITDTLTTLCDLDIARFKLTVHSLSRGLIEFVKFDNRVIYLDDEGEFDVRFVHKTFGYFVQTSQEIAASMEHFNTAIHNYTLKSWLWVVTLAATVPDHGKDDDDVRQLLPAVQHLRTNFDSFGHIVKEILLDKNAWYELIHDSDAPAPGDLASPEYLKLFLYCSRSALFRGLVREHYLRSGQEFSKWLRATPELIWFAYRNYSQALVASIGEIESNPFDRGHDELFRIELTRLVDPWLRTNRWSTNKSNVIRFKYTMALSRCHGWRACFLLLCHLPHDVGPFHDTKSVLTSYGIVQERLLKVSKWWSYDATHISLHFAWTSMYARCRTTQENRIHALKGLGVRLEEEVYAGGDICQAIFACEPTILEAIAVREFYSIWAHPGKILPFFSKAKLIALLTAGFELGDTGYVTGLLQSAVRLLDECMGRVDTQLQLLKERTYHYYLDEDGCVAALIQTSPKFGIRHASVAYGPDGLAGFISSRSRTGSSITCLWEVFEYLAAIHDLDRHVIPFLKTYISTGTKHRTDSLDLETMACAACLPHKNNLPDDESDVENQPRPNWKRVKLQWVEPSRHSDVARVKLNEGDKNFEEEDHV